MNSDDTKGTYSDPRDEHSYKTVKIGEQLWMAENLAWLPYVSPSPDGSNTDKHYYVYGFEGFNTDSAKATKNFTSYGVLYNWEAAQTACPPGWHLPTDEEWMELELFLGMNLEDMDNGFWRDSGEVGKKIKSDTGWVMDDENWGGDNSSKFSALPAGIKIYSGGFFGLLGKGNYCYFWSATEAGESSAWFRCVYQDTGPIGRGNDGKAYGFSVRCLKNQNTFFQGKRPSRLTRNSLSAMDLNNIQSLGFELGLWTFGVIIKEVDSTDCALIIDAIRFNMNNLGMSRLPDSLNCNTKKREEVFKIIETVADKIAEEKGKKVGEFLRIAYYSNTFYIFWDNLNEQFVNPETQECLKAATTSLERVLSAAIHLHIESNVVDKGSQLIDSIHSYDQNCRMNKISVICSEIYLRQIEEWIDTVRSQANQILLKR